MNHQLFWKPIGCWLVVVSWMAPHLHRCQAGVALAMPTTVDMWPASVYFEDVRVSKVIKKVFAHILEFTVHSSSKANLPQKWPCCPSLDVSNSPENEKQKTILTFLNHVYLSLWARRQPEQPSFSRQDIVYRMVLTNKECEFLKNSMHYNLLN